MRGFFKGLFDFFWPYFAAGFLAGTVITLVYGVAGAISFPAGTSTWTWLQFWFVLSLVMSAACTAISIVMEVIGFVIFMIGAVIYLAFKEHRKNKNKSS